jgi:methylated-DNA-[protein]-cysteine S-methyltransferase
MMNTQIFTLSSPVGYWGIITTETHLVSVDWLGESKPAGQRAAETKLEQRLECMLSRYFKGDPIDFRPIPIQLPSTSGYGPLFHRVMQVLSTLPHGEVQSYQWMAEQTGNIKASRAVGGALGRNPIPIVLPCHRIVAKHNRIGGFMQNCPEGGPIKQFLLELEGHRFEGNKLVSTRTGQVELSPV